MGVEDREEPLFLFSFELTEEDYQSVRQEQTLVVDFATFPSRLVGLLQDVQKEEEG